MSLTEILFALVSTLSVVVEYLFGFSLTSTPGSIEFIQEELLFILGILIVINIFQAFQRARNTEGKKIFWQE